MAPQLLIHNSRFDSVSSGRLELVSSEWEKDLEARKEGRPRRRYYELTRAGKEQLREAEARFMAVGRLFPKRSTT